MKLGAFVEDGLYWVTDIGLAAALSVQGAVITRDRRGKRAPDPTRILPACEYSHAKLRVTATVQRQKLPAGVEHGIEARFARLLPGVNTPPDAVVNKPVVLFGFKPYKGGFGLHTNKRTLFYRGAYWPHPSSTTQFRRFRRVIDIMKRQLRADAESKRRAGHTVIDVAVKPEEVRDVNAIEEHPET